MRTRRHVQREKHRGNNSEVLQKKSSFLMKFVFVSVLMSLLMGNIFTFASSVKLTDSITKLEEKTQIIQKENAVLHQKLYAENSLQTLDYIARKSGFTQQAEPYSLGSTDYAMAR